jgi:hypothetical protein
MGLQTHYLLTPYNASGITRQQNKLRGDSFVDYHNQANFTRGITSSSATSNATEETRPLRYIICK